MLCQNLDSNWFFKSSEDTEWYPADVPGCVHTDLLNNNIIQDPFYRLNEHSLQWIDKRDWEYRTEFVPDPDIFKESEIECLFYGLDTVADVYLNGEKILSVDNMFIKHRVNCRDFLVNAINVMHIYFHSPVRVGMERLQRLDYTIPVSDNDLSEIGGLGKNRVSPFIRKAGYHFGWDWGPRLVTSGIWKPVMLYAWSSAVLHDIVLRTREITQEYADVTALAEINSETDFSGKIRVSVDDSIYTEKSVSISKGKNTIRIDLRINRPELWWPNTMGNQKLYVFEFELLRCGQVVDSSCLRRGIRSVVLDQREDRNGSAFSFSVNGVPVFCKGGNYIPQDVFLNRVESQDYERLISDCACAGMNMIRVWGGGIYEKEEFYDLCDRYGIMVWQDFMFACSMYPGDDDFLKSVREEAEYNIRRLRNHTSIVLWCGNNEIMSAWYDWGWRDSVADAYGEERAEEIWETYTTIFHEILPECVRENDPDRPYHSSSPSSDKGVQESLYSGDVHYWGVWAGGKPFESYDRVIPRFMSEFGFQSFPDTVSIKSFTLPEDRELHSEVMESHQRSAPGNTEIQRYMAEEYPLPDDFSMFVYVSQLLQAEAVIRGIEVHRRAMPFCMGSLYWQIDDCWPAASWSGIDYYRRWKALHYYVKRAFKETILSFYENEETLSLYAVTDSSVGVACVLRLYLIDFKGVVRYEHHSEVWLDPHSSSVVFKEEKQKLLSRSEPGDVVVLGELLSEQGERITDKMFYPALPKDLNLLRPNIGVEVITSNTGFRIVLSTDVLVKGLFIRTEYRGRFSDNCFDLLPCSKREIGFFPEDDITQRDLQDNLSMVSLFEIF
ncbi:MAG: beta-mannosidase [Chitinivibrionales bacterium]